MPFPSIMVNPGALKKSHTLKQFWTSLGLSHSTIWTSSPSWRWPSFPLLFVFFFPPGCTVWHAGSWISWPGIKPVLPAWKCGVLTTDLPGNSSSLGTENVLLTTSLANMMQTVKPAQHDIFLVSLLHKDYWLASWIKLACLFVCFTSHHPLSRNLEGENTVHWHKDNT